MNHSTLRKIAAATAVICDEMGGSVEMFFCIKAIYLADRQMLTDYGVPITGDRYSSMPQGPILCSAYDLMTGRYKDDNAFQREWRQAFSKVGHSISPRAKIDTDSLAPAEEATLREKIRLVMGLKKKGVNVAKWMHDNCPEWEQVAKGTSKQLPLRRMITFARQVDPVKAKEMEAQISHGLKIRDGGELGKQPLLAQS